LFFLAGALNNGDNLPSKGESMPTWAIAMISLLAVLIVLVAAAIIYYLRRYLLLLLLLLLSSSSSPLSLYPLQSFSSPCYDLLFSLSFVISFIRLPFSISFLSVAHRMSKKQDESGKYAPLSQEGGKDYNRY